MKGWEPQTEPQPNLSGVVVDVDGNPIERAQVILRYCHPDMKNEVRLSVRTPDALRTNASGEFAFVVPEDLWFRLSVYPQGKYREEELLLKRPETGLVVTLKKFGTLSGRVVDAETDAPITRFKLYVDLSRSPWCRFLQSEMQSSLILFEDADGRFEMARRDDVYDLTVIAEGYAVTRTPPIELRIGADVDDVVIRMAREAKLTGDVRDAVTHAPIADAAVHVSSPEYPRLSFSLAATDGEGIFALDKLPAETIAVTIQAEGYQPRKQEVTLQKGEATHLAFQLERVPVGAIRGHVVDKQTGEPIEAAEVSCSSPTGSGQTTTVEDGSFAVEELPLSSYELTTKHAAYAPVRIRIVGLSPEQPNAEVRVELSAGTRLYGTATWASGRAVGGARVSIPEWPSIEGQTDMEGRYSIEHVPRDTREVELEAGRGEYMFHEYPLDRFVVRKKVELAEGEEQRLDFVIGGFSVSGRVTMDNEPANEAFVELFCEDRYTLTRTGQDGSFEFFNVLPGSYVVWARPNRTARRSAEQTVEVRKADVVVDLDLFLGVVSGRVLAERTGEPIGWAKVELRRVDASPWRDARCEAPDAVRLGLREAWGPAAHGGPTAAWITSVEAKPDDGAYCFEFIPDGQYCIVARKGGYGVGSVEVDIVNGRPTRPTDIWLDATTVTLHGTITAADPDMQLEHAFLRLREINGPVLLETRVLLDENGRYSFDGLAPGEYVLGASSEDTAWIQREIAVYEQHEKVDFRLPTGNSLMVQINGHNGRPVSGADVIVHPIGDPSLLYRADTDAHGNTSVKHLTTGAYRILIQAPGGVRAEYELQLPDGHNVLYESVLENSAAD